MRISGYGDPIVPSRIAGAVRLVSTLTTRERATLDLLGDGCDNRSIARALGISERTVKRYITAILQKLGVESRLQAGLVGLMVASRPWPEGRMETAVTVDDNSYTPAYRSTLSEQTMSFDALDALRQVGNPVDMLTERERDVFAQLSEAEVAVLVSIKERLDAVSDNEVEGHGSFKIV